MQRITLFNGFGVSAVGALCVSVLLHAAPASPVADAAQRGDNGAVRALLKQAADVNAAQPDGMTALHWAATRDDVDLAQMLLYAGANVKAATRINAYTPLLLAAKSGNRAVMDPLLNAGADVNARTSNGTTALMFAAASGNTGAVTVLLDHRADVNAKESVRGLTALMFAAAANRAAVVGVLAKHGADLKATTAVVDLNAFARNSAAFNGVLFGNPAPPPPAGAPAPADARGGRGATAEGRGAAGGAAGGSGGGRNPFAGRAGIDRQ